MSSGVFWRSNFYRQSYLPAKFAVFLRLTGETNSWTEARSAGRSIADGGCNKISTLLQDYPVTHLAVLAAQKAITTDGSDISIREKTFLYFHEKQAANLSEIKAESYGNIKDFGKTVLKVWLGSVGLALPAAGLLYVLSASLTLSLLALPIMPVLWTSFFIISYRFSRSYPILRRSLKCLLFKPDRQAQETISGKYPIEVKDPAKISQADLIKPSRHSDDAIQPKKPDRIISYLFPISQQLALLADLAETVTPAGQIPTILEVGSGSGLISYLLAKKGIRAIGVEPDSHLVRKCSREYGLKKIAPDLWRHPSLELYFISTAIQEAGSILARLGVGLPRFPEDIVRAEAELKNQVAVFSREIRRLWLEPMSVTGPDNNHHFGIPALADAEIASDVKGLLSTYPDIMKAYQRLEEAKAQHLAQGNLSLAICSWMPDQVDLTRQIRDLGAATIVYMGYEDPESEEEPPAKCPIIRNAGISELDLSADVYCADGKENSEPLFSFIPPRFLAAGVFEPSFSPGPGYSNVLGLKGLAHNGEEAAIIIQFRKDALPASKIIDFKNSLKSKPYPWEKFREPECN